VATLEERVALIEADIKIILDKMNRMDAGYSDVQARIAIVKDDLSKTGWFGKETDT